MIMLLLEIFEEVPCFEFGKSSQWSFFNLDNVIKSLPLHCWLEFCYLWWLSEGTMGLFEFFFSWRSWHTLTWFCFCSWLCRWGTVFFHSSSHIEILYQNALQCFRWDTHVISQVIDSDASVFMNKFLNCCHIFFSFALHFWAWYVNWCLSFASSFLLKTKFNIMQVFVAIWTYVFELYKVCVVGHEQASCYLFQCVVSVLWMLIVYLDMKMWSVVIIYHGMWISV
jgi:hypothetical protein